MADEATERISRRKALLGMTAAGAGAGALAFPSTAAAATAAQYNVQEAAYRALGDGRTDDASAIQAAINAANAAGGGTVYFPAGTYIVGTTLTLYSRIYLVGAGVDATRLKLRERASTDLLESSGYEELVGTGKWEMGIEFAGLVDLTLDGNKSGGNTSGTGLKHYGRCLVIRNATIGWFAGDGISSERGFGGDQMEAHVSGLVVRDCEGTGIDWRGPHDSTFVNVHVIRSGSKGIRLRGGTGSVRGGYGAAGTMFLNSHVWGEPQTKAWELEQGCYLTQCSGEGASESALHIKANDCVIVGGNYFANEGGSYAIKHGESGVRPRRTIIQGIRAGQAVTADVNFVEDGGHGMFHFVIEKGERSTAHIGRPAESSQWFISIDDPRASPNPYTWTYFQAFGGVEAFELFARVNPEREGFVLRTIETGRLGFHGSSPIEKPPVRGSRGGNAALASLLTALANYGLITNETTA